MNINRYFYDLHIEALKDAGRHLSDECIEFIKRFDTIEFTYRNITDFYNIALAYCVIIEDRFYSHEDDEQDYDFLKRMVRTIEFIEELIYKINSEHIIK